MVLYSQVSKIWISFQSSCEIEVCYSGTEVWHRLTETHSECIFVLQDLLLLHLLQNILSEKVFGGNKLIFVKPSRQLKWITVMKRTVWATWPTGPCYLCIASMLLYPLFISFLVMISCCCQQTVANWNSAPVFLAIVSEGYSSLNLTKSGPYHVCSEKLKRFLPENSSCAAVFSAAATFRLASLCEAPLQVSSSATSFELREFNTVYSVLSHLWLTEAAGDNAKEAHTGLWHYRVQCLSGPDTEPLLRQYQQLLCADSSEGLHFPDIGGTNGKLTCRCVCVHAGLVII